MLLPFTDGLILTHHFDHEAALLADRHYSRRTVGARQFCYSGKKIVLRNAAGTLVFVWMFPNPTMRMDHRAGFHNTLFRNESSRLSSEIILEAETFAVQRWGPSRAWSFIDSRKIASRHPGYCYLKAGWDYERDASGDLVFTKDGKHVVTKELA
jgi:hypothetical protein